MLEDYPRIRPGPPKPSVILEPKVFSLPPGTERYVIPGAGAILVPVYAGDKFTITNDEGGQPCEIVITDDYGTLSPEILGHTSSKSADGLKALLTTSDQSLHGLRMGLDARSINLARLADETLPRPRSPHRFLLRDDDAKDSANAVHEVRICITVLVGFAP